MTMTIEERQKKKVKMWVNLRNDDDFKRSTIFQCNQVYRAIKKKRLDIVWLWPVDWKGQRWG